MNASLTISAYRSPSLDLYPQVFRGSAALSAPGKAPYKPAARSHPVPFGHDEQPVGDATGSVLSLDRLLENGIVQYLICQ